MEQTCLYTLILPQSFPRRPHVSPHAPFISAETYFSSVSKGKNSSVQQKSTRRGRRTPLHVLLREAFHLYTEMR